eukprot:TRINITY_DN2980_c0_g1_i4.p1 TRINITY_DN2980_c0_g1~~TRINITY_DN2980_c0_g1_i4.p1  ORF type:complete len:531 (+),score=102.57 TRINITY_DN2980_c0_g1_i4:47-1639(+)
MFSASPSGKTRLSPEHIGGSPGWKPVHMSQYVAEDQLTWVKSQTIFTPVYNDESIIVDIVKRGGVTVPAHDESTPREHRHHQGAPQPHEQPREFLRGGPRDTLFYAPKSVRAAIVTCGGICPGLNSVIRELVMCLHYCYEAECVFGVRYGYEGFYGHDWMDLTPDLVGSWSLLGGTQLGTSRGGFDLPRIVDGIIAHNVNQVYILGGDGTHRGAHAIFEEVKKRKLKIAVVGIPKTIDNDIPLIDKSFGFDTAVQKAVDAIRSAHVEVKSCTNGLGLVLLMGRASGFIALEATLSSSEANACLIPEVQFKLPAFLAYMEKRIQGRGHAVVVVAEGAGLELMLDNSVEPSKDKSGNPILPEIGVFLKNAIKDHFKQKKIEINLKYIDPSYMIRSVPANAADNSYSLLLAHNAVHGAMAGFSGFTMGLVNTHYCYIPLDKVVTTRKVDPLGRQWQRVICRRGMGEAGMEGMRRGECTGDSASTLRAARLAVHSPRLIPSIPASPIPLRHITLCHWRPKGSTLRVVTTLSRGI